MTGSHSGEVPPLAWSSVTHARQGQSASGDLPVVLPNRHGALVALVDGLGHGPEAAAAAAIAGGVIASNVDAAPDHLARDCHHALRRTRGAVLAIACIDITAETVTWVCIGNISGVIVRQAGPREHLLMQAGLVGDRLPNVRKATVRFGQGDLLVLSSDGVRPEYGASIRPTESTEFTAFETQRTFGMTTDDSTVLALRWPTASQ